MFDIIPLGSLMAWREQERADILAYGEALSAEQAAYRAVEVWTGLYEKCRLRMEAMHPHDRERLHAVLKDAEAAAIDAHQTAAADLHALGSPFTAIAEIMSRAAGT